MENLHAVPGQRRTLIVSSILGVAQSGEFENVELSLDRLIFDVNVFGTINLSKIVCRHWLETGQKGHIVMNSSTSAILRVSI